MEKQQYNNICNIITTVSAHNNNKFKISTPTWNDKFDLPDGSYSISDIQDYFWVYH